MQMFNFFKKNKTEKKSDDEASFEIELTAAVLAYEVARSDGEISDTELNVLMEEISIISEKVGKDESEIIKTTLKRKRYCYLNLFGKLHTQMVN